METINVRAEYALLLHSLDGGSLLCQLDKSKFSLFTLGRGPASCAHLSLGLIPDDPDPMGMHFLSSMQCYFAWDAGLKDWVVGNGKPPEKYIPQEKKPVYAKVSSGPASETNMVHVCYNHTEDCSPASSRFVLLGSRRPAPETLKSILGIAFLRNAGLMYKGKKVPPQHAETQGIKGPIPYGFLIEVIQPNVLDSIRVSNKKVR
jgi:hypothetical protein